MFWGVDLFSWEIVQTGTFAHSLHITQLYNIEVEKRIEVAVLLEGLVILLIERTCDISLSGPTLGLLVELCIRRLESRDHRATLVLLQGEERCSQGVATEASQIEECTRLDLTIDVAVVLVVLSSRNILLLEGDTGALRNRYHPQTQRQRHNGDDRSADKVWPHKSAEAHSTRQHRHNLGLVGEFRGEEYAGYEGEQSTKLIDEEGDKIEVIVLDNALEWRFGCGEAINLLDIVEDDHHHDNHSNGEYVGSEELTDDVAVENLESRPEASSFLVLWLHCLIQNAECKISFPLSVFRFPFVKVFVRVSRPSLSSTVRSRLQ